MGRVWFNECLCGLVVLALTVFPTAVAAQDPLRPHRFAQPPQIDGRVTDVEWNGVSALPLTNLYPSFGSPLTERTEIRIGYDAQYVYASIRAWDSEPHRVRASTLYRDRWETDDEFVVILDTFADGQSAAMFLVTAAGVRVDNQLSHDTEPGRGEWMNRDWNVPWDAAGMHLPDGWSAEMRIPFSSLRFRADAGEVLMRVKTYRYLPRKGENQMYPATRPDAGANPHFKPSLGHAVVFEGVQAAVPLYLQPSISGTTAARGSSARELDASLDAKWTPTRGTALDMTVNTDFAQVEVDQLQVNLTRFPLRFPERRPFFLERAGLFAVGLGSNETLFHSRRVGLTEDGAPRPILGGVRFAGRVTGWDVGLLSVQTEGDRGTNASVLRAQRSSPSGATFGVAATTHAGGGRTDVAASLDGSLGIGRHRVTGVWAASSGSGPARERTRAMLNWQRGGEQGVSFTTEYRFTGREFQPSLGFVRITNSHEVDAVVRQSWRPVGSTSIRRHGWVFNSASRWMRASATGAAAREATRAEFGWNAELTSGYWGQAAFEVVDEILPVPFAITARTTAAPGRYRMGRGRLSFATPQATAWRVFATAEAGGFYGGRRISLRVEPVWTPNRHFQGWVIYDGTRLMYPSQSADRLDLVIGGARAALNTKVFVDVIAQRATSVPFIGQLRFRLNPSEGHDLWIVAERGHTATRGRIQSLSVKYTRLFVLAGRRG